MMSRQITVRITFLLLIIDALIWLTFAIITAAGMHPALPDSPTSKWVTASLALAACTALPGLYLLARRFGRVGFYPLLGSRVWCRFGCPQAAILGLWQRLFSRFRITTNGGQCMSCGNCSTYCEMGIDVRAYAQRSENIVRASCVGCGVCAAVCPRGVLKLGNGDPGDRYEGADKPLADLVASLKGTDIYGYKGWDPSGPSDG